MRERNPEQWEPLVYENLQNMASDHILPSRLLEWKVMKQCHPFRHEYFTGSCLSCHHIHTRLHEGRQVKCVLKWPQNYGLASQVGQTDPSWWAKLIMQAATRVSNVKDTWLLFWGKPALTKQKCFQLKKIFESHNTSICSLKQICAEEEAKEEVGVEKVEKEEKG